MNLRRLASLTALVSFVLLMASSTVLYVAPHGRVAYWSAWHWAGASYTQWGNLHINLGLLFLLAAAVHIYLNWHPITAYLRDRLRRLVILTREMVAALILTLVFCAGTLTMAPPLAWVIDLSAAAKEAGTRRHGEPPYGHAELSTFQQFSGKMQLDLGESLARLRAAGLTIEGPRQTLAAAAEANDLSPRRLYELMQPAADERGDGQQP